MRQPTVCSPRSPALYRCLATAAAALLILELAACGKASPDSDLSGSFATGDITENFLVYRDVDLARVTAFIAKKDRNSAPAITDRRMALLLSTVARCFGLDKRIYTSLVAQESAFATDAVSATGAVGLTQMTATAITEVNDQLGHRGDAYARSSTTAYFRRTIATCAAAGTNWTDLWQRAASTAGMKAVLRADARAALIYGAVLLKTDLSAAKLDDTTALPSTVYRTALRRYNGDPDEAEHYQSVIMAAAATEF